MAMDRLQKSVQGIKDPAKRKAEYYKRQRQDSEETGNQDQTNKIYGKMGKKAQNVDSSRGDKAILGGVAALAGGGEGALAKGVGAIAKRVAPKATAKVAEFGSSLAKKAGGAMSKAYQDLGKARPVGNKLGSGVKKVASSSKPAAKAVKPALKDVTPKKSAMSKPADTPALNKAKPRSFVKKSSMRDNDQQDSWYSGHRNLQQKRVKQKKAA